MEEIIIRIRLSEKSPPLKIPLLEQLGYDGMKGFRDGILIGTEMCQDKGDQFTRNFIRQLKSVTRTLAEKYSTITMDDYTKDYRQLIKDTSLVPLNATQYMVNT